MSWFDSKKEKQNNFSCSLIFNQSVKTQSWSIWLFIVPIRYKCIKAISLLDQTELDISFAAPSVRIASRAKAAPILLFGEYGQVPNTIKSNIFNMDRKCCRVTLLAGEGSLGVDDDDDEGQPRLGVSFSLLPRRAFATFDWNWHKSIWSFFWAVLLFEISLI